jgi:hypothetical protein
MAEIVCLFLLASRFGSLISDLSPHSPGDALQSPSLLSQNHSLPVSGQNPQWILLVVAIPRSRHLL